MGVAVDSTGAHTPETNRSKSNQQHSAEHLAAALHNHRQRPTQQDDALAPSASSNACPTAKRNATLSARARFTAGASVPVPTDSVAIAIR